MENPLNDFSNIFFNSPLLKFKTIQPNSKNNSSPLLFEMNQPIPKKTTSINQSLRWIDCSNEGHVQKRITVKRTRYIEDDDELIPLKKAKTDTIGNFISLYIFFLIHSSYFTKIYIITTYDSNRRKTFPIIVFFLSEKVIRTSFKSL
jgi:hypothetical protein